MPGGIRVDLIFIFKADYLAIQEAEEAEMEAQFEQMRKRSAFFAHA